MSTVKNKVLFGALAVCVAFACMLLAGCSSNSGDSSESSDSGESINVVSREDGSGTRGAFVELFGVEQEDENGETVDMTTESASITNSTAVMMTTVAGDANAIGYISLGSLDDSVKAVKIDGAEATVDNVKSGDYKVSRPFNVVTNSNTELSDVAQDFMNFILSSDGQAVVAEEGYIPLDGGEAYTASNLSGTVTVAGSSSVTPVMEKLAEAYQALNPDVTIEVNQSDSTTGVTSAIEGACDLGMASRDLKDSETSEGAQATVIATDGIAIAVHKDNPVSDLTQEQIAKIFTGEITNWSEVGGQDQAITVLGREASSGTRDGFEAIFGVEGEAKYAAELTSTGEVLNRVASDPAAVGYISLASVSPSIKAVKVDGVEATDENILNGTYKVSRPFIQIYKKGTDSELVKAWFDFIKSDEGKQVIEDVGLIPAE